MKRGLEFIVVGAAKAGTTTLFEYMRRHPKLVLPPDKEAPYFSQDSVYAAGWESYAKKTFPSHGAEEGVWGTITPHYMAGSVCEQTPTSATPGRNYNETSIPGRMYQDMPTTRIIAILRNPIDRARSDHKMAVLRGQESRKFADAVRELLRPDALVASRKRPGIQNRYVVWGEYGRILSGYYEVFPREQILVVFTSDLEQDPITTLQRIYEFIGVEPDVSSVNVHKRYNEGATQRRVPGLSLERFQARATESQALRAAWRRLPTGMRDRILRAYRGASLRVDLWNRERSTEDARTEVSENILYELQEHFASDTDLLASITGETPPWQDAGRC